MEKINKQEALNKLNELRIEFAKKGKELEDIINAPDKKDWTSVKSFEDACEFLGINADDKENKWIYADLTLSQIAGLKLEYCIKAINEGWKSNFNNVREYKYYPWFSSGCWSFDSVYDGSDYGHMSFGFYYETKEKAQFGAKYFKQYYNVWLGN